MLCTNMQSGGQKIFLVQLLQWFCIYPIDQVTDSSMYNLKQITFSTAEIQYTVDKSVSQSIMIKVNIH